MPYTPMQLAEAFLKTGELVDALEALNEQLQQQPGDAEARRLRAALYLRLPQPQPEAALADLRLIESPISEDAILKSVLHERLGDPAEACHSLEIALQQFRDAPRLLERLIGLYQKQGRYDDALQRIREQPKQWRWLQWEGDLLAERGDDFMATARYNLALAQLEEAAETMQADYRQALQARIRIACGHAYRRLGQLDLAQQYYEAAQAHLPDDPGIAFNIGLLQALAGNTEAARQICQPSLDASPPQQRDALLQALDAPQFAALRAALNL